MYVHFTPCIQEASFTTFWLYIYLYLVTTELLSKKDGTQILLVILVLLWEWIRKKTFPICSTFVCWNSSSHVFYKQTVLEKSSTSQENNCTRVSFQESCRPKTWNLIKKKLRQRLFPMSFAEHLLTNASTLQR